MKIYEIAYLHHVGKWMEVWFVGSVLPVGKLEEDETGTGWSRSCKAYMLYDLLDAELRERVLNHGFVGLGLHWPHESDRPLRIVPAIGATHDYLADLSASPVAEIKQP